jgi:hypothetical protein
MLADLVLDDNLSVGISDHMEAARAIGSVNAANVDNVLLAIVVDLDLNVPFARRLVRRLRCKRSE